MNRDQERATVDGYCIQVLIVNGEVQDQHSQKSLYIENIGKGGFRFISSMKFDLEDRCRFYCVSPMFLTGSAGSYLLYRFG